MSTEWLLRDLEYAMEAPEPAGTKHFDSDTVDVLRKAFNKGSLAHVIIDVQRRFKDNSYLDIETDQIVPATKHNEQVFRRTQRLAYLCRDYNVPNIWVAYDEDPDFRPTAKSFFIAKPTEHEARFGKKTPSAFASGRFGYHIRRERYDTLMISGVYSNACVKLTIESALSAHYNVIAVADAIDLNEHTEDAVRVLYGTDVFPSDTKQLASFFKAGPKPS